MSEPSNKAMVLVENLHSLASKSGRSLGYEPMARGIREASAAGDELLAYIAALEVVREAAEHVADCTDKQPLEVQCRIGVLRTILAAVPK